LEINIDMYKMKFKYFSALMLSATLLACSNPSIVRKPVSSAIAAQRLNPALINNNSEHKFIIRVGDTLRIIRNAQQLERASDATLFLINTEGVFNYPYAGVINGAGKTLAEIQKEINSRLKQTYKEPNVTVNIVEVAGNKYFIAGAVARPSAYEIDSPVSLEQAIMQAGGILTAADSENVALLRLNSANKYQVYFFDYGGMLSVGSVSDELVFLERGDMIYVPKSGIGNAIDNVDMYLNKLIPFTKGVGFNYELNRP